MKKKSLFFSAVTVILVIPQIAFAAWWNPFSWKIFDNFFTPKQDTETQFLKEQVKELERKLDAVTVTSTATTTNPTSAPIVSVSKNEEKKTLPKTQLVVVVPQKIETKAIPEAIPVVVSALQSQIDSNVTECQEIKSEIHEFSQLKIGYELLDLMKNYGHTGWSEPIDSTYVYNRLLAQKETLYQKVNDLKQEIKLLNYPHADPAALLELKTAYMNAADAVRESFDLKLRGFQMMSEADWQKVGYDNAKANIESGHQLVITAVENMKKYLDQNSMKVHYLDSKYQSLLSEKKCPK